MKIRKTLVATALLALVAVAAVIAAGIVVPGGAPQAQAADPVVLTVTGNGQSKTFTMAELKALPVYSGYFGSRTPPAPSILAPPARASGSSDVLAQIGGMTTLNACDVLASDGYGMTYTFNQLVNNAGVQFYDETTKAKEAPPRSGTSSWPMKWTARLSAPRPGATVPSASSSLRTRT